MNPFITFILNVKKSMNVSRAKRVKFHSPLDPLLLFLSRPAAVILGSITRGDLEAVFLSQDRTVQWLDLDGRRRQVYGMHAGRGREQGLVRARGTHPTVD